MPPSDGPRNPAAEPRPLAPEGPVADHRSDDGVEGRHRQANVESATEPVLFEAGAVGCPLMITRQGRYDWQLRHLPFGPTAAGSTVRPYVRAKRSRSDLRKRGQEGFFSDLPRPAWQSREVVPGRRLPRSGGQGSMTMPPPIVRRADESRNNRSL